MHFGYKVVYKSNRFRAIAQHIEKAVARIIFEEAQNAASIARQLAPVLTGNLRDSIAIEIPKSGNMLSVRVVASAPYAAFVELGTVNTEPQPFLGPAMQAVRDNLINRLLKLESQLPAELAKAA